MKRYLLSAAAAAAFTVALPAGAQTVLTVSSWVPPTHALSVAQKEWCALVEKNSAGKVRCNILPRGVANPPGTFDAVKNGLADVSFTVHGYTPGRFVLTQMAEFPFLGDSSEPISVAFNRVAMKYPQFLQEHQGVHVLAFFTHGPGIVFNTKRPITKVTDLQGLKWRVGGGMVNEISKSLDMNVTLKPAPDSYELLSGGVMDGTLFPAESTESFKIDKIIKYATTFPGGLYNTSFAMFMNEGTWGRISAADRAAIEKLSGEALARRLGREWDIADRRGVEVLTASGVDSSPSDPALVEAIRQKTQGLEQQWIDAAKQKGMPNAGQLLQELRSEIAKLQR